MKNKKQMSPQWGEEGTTLVESALVLPVIILLLLGIIQFGLLFAATVVLRSASLVTARYVAIVNPGIASDHESIPLVAKDAVSPLLDPSKLTWKVDDVNVGGVASARRVELVYDMALFFPMVVPNAQNGRLLMKSELVMR